MAGPASHVGRGRLSMAAGRSGTAGAPVATALGSRGGPDRRPRDGRGSMSTSRKAVACVMGDIDLVRALGLAGIPCAVVARPGVAPRFSRFTHTVIDWVDAWERADRLVETLLRFGAAQREPPVLFYQEDRELLLVPRYRDQLARVFRFVVPDATLVE